MTSKRKALGKGLSALITEEFEKIDEHSIIQVALDMIRPNPMQPRKTLNDEKLAELADSIARHGVIQPIILKKSGEAYEIIAGERRWRASIKAGLKKIPAIVRDLDNRSQEEMALIENIQREDLNAIDEAQAYQVIMERYAVTQEALSDIVGKSRVHVTNSLRLLKLPVKVQEGIISGKLSPGHGKTMVGLEEKIMSQVYQRIINEDLSVRETEKLVKALKSKKSQKRTVRRSIKEPNILHIEEKLTEILGTKVEIQKGKKSGKIHLHFTNEDELTKIIGFFSEEFK